jgi:hypothetical protein
MPRVWYSTVEPKKRSLRMRFISLLVGLMALSAAIAPIASAGLSHG